MKRILDHKSCENVERAARAVGRDCQIIFTDDGVEIAPLSWAGSVTARNLFDALREALAERE